MLSNPLPVSEDIAFRLDALYHWLSRKYRIEFFDRAFGDRAYRFYQIKDIDELIDRVIMESPEPDEHAPYWSELWPSSLALADFIADQDLTGKTAIELGSGLGVCGIVAAGQGADLQLSDIAEDSLRISELNWILNFKSLPRSRFLDWRKPDESINYDVIIASDVAYEERLFGPLINTFKALLNSHGEILLSEPNRSVARPFFELLQQAGYSWEQCTRAAESDGKILDISIYRIKHRGNLLQGSRT